MKILLLLLLMAIITINAEAQKKIFIRLYDLAGHKFAKGFFAGSTDSSILLIKKNIIREVTINTIGIIKTKRSEGNTLLISTITGAITIGIVMAATSPSKKNDATFADVLSYYTPWLGFEAGFIIGSVAGAVTGAFIGVFKKSRVFFVQGKEENWFHIKPAIDMLPVTSLNLHTE